MPKVSSDTLQQRIIAYLRTKARSVASLRGSGLVDRMARDLKADRIDVLRVVRQLRADGVLDCQDWMRDEPQGKVQVQVPQQLSASALAWLGVLQQSVIEDPKNAATLSALQPLGQALEGLDERAMLGLLSGLLELRRDQAQLAGTPRFEVAARYLLGSSKLLDALPSAALREFGIDLAMFPAFPGYVMVAGPAQPEVVVLVENPHAFETAVAATLTEPVAWVCTFGYGLSLKHSQHGEQLAAMVGNERQPISLTRSGTPPDWATLLGHPRLLFWGDLDLAGLAIYERLRSYRPYIALSGLYQPMLEALLDGCGHPYCKAAGKPVQLVPEHGEDIARLIDGCRQQAVDQELVTLAQIAAHWSDVLAL